VGPAQQRLKSNNRMSPECRASPPASSTLLAVESDPDALAKRVIAEGTLSD
jgi:hypothetical protein